MSVTIDTGRNLGYCPIGSIIAWAPHLPGCSSLLPYGWFKYEGGVIPYGTMAGQTAPDLNGTNRFLRGDYGSGATGGASTQVHTYDGRTDAPDTGECDYVKVELEGELHLAKCRHTHPYTGTTDASSIIPPYMMVIWIMRIA